MAKPISPVLSQVAVPAARRVAANVPLAASVRAIPAAPAAVNEVNVIVFLQQCDSVRLNSSSFCNVFLCDDNK